MNVMQTFVNGIQKLLQQKLNIYTPVITAKTDLKKDLKLADWELLYLLNAVEKKWQICINQTDVETIDNVKQLVALVKKTVTEGKA